MLKHKINNNIILRLISHNDAERIFTTVEKNREFLREWLNDHFHDMVLYSMMKREWGMAVREELEREN